MSDIRKAATNALHALNSVLRGGPLTPSTLAVVRACIAPLEAALAQPEPWRGEAWQAGYEQGKRVQPEQQSPTVEPKRSNKWTNHLGMLYVGNVREIPAEAHLVVIQEESITVPGYDRNDPSESATVLRYIAFESEQALEAWIIRQDEVFYVKKPYKVLRVNPVTIEKKVNINIKIG